MDLEIETIIIIFEINQSSNLFHPMTCSGGGGTCDDTNLKARKVEGKREIEAYCPVCKVHTQKMHDSSTIDFLMQKEDYKNVYNRLLKISRDGKIKNIINNK
jgi:formylmethanofuran dehydrogenase subunit B